MPPGVRKHVSEWICKYRYTTHNCVLDVEAQSGNV